MAQSSGYGAGPGSVDLSAGVTGGSTGATTGATAGSTTSEGGATDQARQTAQEATGQAREKVQDVAGQAREQASQAAGQAKGVLRSQVDQRSTQAGQQIKQQADDIRTVGEQLRSQGKEGPAKVADQAAQRIERLGSYLHQADTDTIIDDVERFARSNPWVVIAGGITTGFLAARALKASSVERYRAGGGTARGQIPRSGATTGGYTGVGGEFGAGVGAGTGAGAVGADVDDSGAYVGGGISGRPVSEPIPPATSVPPVSDPLGTPPRGPGGSGAGVPPAGGL